MFFVRGLIATCVVVFLLNASTSALAQRPSTVAEEIVRITFNSYRAAVLGRDGAKAAQYIDDESAALYEKIRVAALVASKAELLKTSLFFQAAVFSVRHHLTKDDIQKITGRDLYGKTVSFGDASSSMG